MKVRPFLFFLLSILLFQTGIRAQEHILVPKQANEYVRIYKPDGDYFFGPDTPNLKGGNGMMNGCPTTILL